MASFDNPDMSDMTMAASTADLDVDRRTPGMDDDDEHRGRRVMSAGTLAGDRVRNSAGDDLGKIEEIMLDVPTGRVAYAVLSFGGFLGMGNKLFAVPWQALTLNERDHEFILNVEKQVLDNAPGFDKDNWPDMAEPDFGAEVFSTTDISRIGKLPNTPPVLIPWMKPARRSTGTATAPCAVAEAAPFKSLRRGRDQSLLFPKNALRPGLLQYPDLPQRP